MCAKYIFFTFLCFSNSRSVISPEIRPCTLTPSSQKMFLYPCLLLFVLYTGASYCTNCTLCSVHLLKITHQARQPAHRGYQGSRKRVKRRGVLFDDLVMTLDTYLKEVYSGSARCSVHLPVARSFMGCWNEAVCCASPYPAN